MEFQYIEYEFPQKGAPGGRRISSLLADSSYHSLSKDSAQLLERYLHLGAEDAALGPAAGPRTVDVLIPPADSTARIVVSERASPDPEGGVIVTVVALGRTQEEAHRTRTALKLILDTKVAPDGRRAAGGDNDRAVTRRFRQEWVPALGLDHPDQGGVADPPSSSRDMATVEALIALHDAPPLLDRPAVLRSRLVAGAALLEGLVAEGLVDRSFVLVCQDNHQIVGVGKDSGEVKAAQVALQCPHCRRPMSEEIQDVLYALNPRGEELIMSSRWIREAVDTSLRKRGCEAVIAADGAAGRTVDGAACYQGVVLLLRVKDGAPRADDIQALLTTVMEFVKTAPGVPVRGVFVAAKPPSPEVIQEAVSEQAECTVLDASHLESGLDHLLEDLKRDNFIRLTGTALELVRPDSLLTGNSQ